MAAERRRLLGIDFPGTSDVAIPRVQGLATRYPAELTTLSLKLLYLGLRKLEFEPGSHLIRVF